MFQQQSNKQAEKRERQELRKQRKFFLPLSFKREVSSLKAIRGTTDSDSYRNLCCGVAVGSRSKKCCPPPPLHLSHHFAVTETKESCYTKALWVLE